MSDEVAISLRRSLDGSCRYQSAYVFNSKIEVVGAQFCSAENLQDGRRSCHRVTRSCLLGRNGMSHGASKH